MQTTFMTNIESNSKTKQEKELQKIDRQMEELCHQAHDAWSAGDIDTHIKILKNMQVLAERGKEIRKEIGDTKKNDVIEWIDI